MEHLSRGCESVLRFVTLRCLLVLFKRAIEIARFHIIARFFKQHRRALAIPRASQVLTQKSRSIRALPGLPKGFGGLLDFARLPVVARGRIIIA